MINICKKIYLPLLLLLIILYPFLPSFGSYNSDLLIVLTLTISYIYIYNTYIRRELHSIFKLLISDSLLSSLLLLNIFMYISSFFALNKFTTLVNSSRFSLYICIFILISYFIKSSLKFNYVLSTFILSYCLVSFYSFIHLLSKLYHGEKITRMNRLISVLETTNLLGCYSIMFIFIFISILITSKNLNYKIFSLIIIIISLINIISSQSRNSLLALIFGFTLMIILYKIVLLKYILLLPILLFIPKIRVLLLQVFDINQNSSRIKIWITTSLIIRDNFLTGIGYENYNLVYGTYISKYPSLLGPDGLNVFHPHNLLLKILCELGLLGFISFIIFIITSLKVTLFLLNQKLLLNKKPHILGIIIGFVSFLFMNITDSFFTSPKILLTMFIMLGILNYYKQNAEFFIINHH